MAIFRRDRDPWLGYGLLMLAVGLAANTLFGPLFLGVVSYPFTATVVNETIGLEAVSLALIAPVAVLAGVLVLRGRPAGQILALGPVAYVVYMMVQYVVGPQYPTYQPAIAGHLALLVLAVVLLLRAWASTPTEATPLRSRGWAVAILAMTAFIVSRWLPAFAAMPSADAVPAASPDLTMYWSIFLLDLGFVVPAGVATGIGLLRGSRWASKALYGLLGWFALVPPSVAAMSIVKLLRHDPNAVAADSVVFAAVTIVFWVVAAWGYRRLFTRAATDADETAGPAPAISGS